MYNNNSRRQLITEYINNIQESNLLLSINNYANIIYIILLFK